MDVLAYQDDQLTLGIDCACCGQTTEMTVSLKAYNSWITGTLIQEAFPDMPPADRELFISRTCGTCWQDMFGLPTH